MSDHRHMSDVTALDEAVTLLARRFDILEKILIDLDKKLTHIEELQVGSTQRHVEEMVEDPVMSKPYFDHQAVQLGAHWLDSFVTALGKKTLSLVGYCAICALVFAAGYFASRK